MFGFSSKKKKLFGNSVEPDCRYCIHNASANETVIDCPESAAGKPEAPCRRFSYDPLKRSPQNLPPLPQYDPEDFSL